jgi:hypothetical protein
MPLQSLTLFDATDLVMATIENYLGDEEVIDFLDRQISHELERRSRREKGQHTFFFLRYLKMSDAMFEPFNTLLSEIQELIQIAKQLDEELRGLELTSDPGQIRAFDEGVDIDWTNSFVSVTLQRQSFDITMSAEFVLVPSDIEVTEYPFLPTVSNLREACEGVFAKVKKRTAISGQLRGELEQLDDYQIDLDIFEILVSVIRSILSIGGNEPSLNFDEKGVKLVWKDRNCYFENDGVQIDQAEKKMRTKKEVLKGLDLIE